MKTYIGHSREIFNWRVRAGVLIHFLPLMLAEMMSPVKFVRFARRLLFFLSKMKRNKYVETPLGVKLSLYVPAYPTPAFFQACRKVLVNAQRMPSVTVLMSVTSACRFSCSHCYQRLDKGKDVALPLLVNAARYLQDKGTAFFNLEGGEPFLVFDRLQALCNAIDSRSEILINSTGDGITKVRLEKLKERGNLFGIMFSLHTPFPEKLNEFMGSPDAWDTLVRGIDTCHRTGVAVTFNSCLMKEAFYDGTFEKVMDCARELGGLLVQVIKPKPAGAWLEEGAGRFSSVDLAIAREKMLNYNNLDAFRSWPSIAPMIIDEDHDHFGCTAGGTDRFYINAKGDVQPCEFLNISFGNIAEEPFPQIYEKMRRAFGNPGDNWLCEQCAPAIAETFRQHRLNSLPLPPGFSEGICSGMEPGSIPDFYEKVIKI